MAWFIKTETFRLPRLQLLAHLQAHHAWVAELRQQGVVITSGYLVDQAGRPGGGCWRRRITPPQKPWCFKTP